MTKRMNKFPTLSPGVSLVDTHCHLDMKTYNDDLDAVLERAAEHGVHTIITIGIDLESSRRAVKLAEKYACLKATVGIHPHDVDDTGPKTYSALADLVEANRNLIVGYGEIGLDYFKEYSAADNQRLHFANQLSLARELQLPVVIHDRDAHDDTLRLLKASGATEFGGVMHCFSGDLVFARKVLELGFFISFPGVVTFKNAIELQEVARAIPLESILVETDGPYLAPHPMRGKRNEPVNVLYTAAHIAELRNIPLDEVARQTTANAARLFKLPPVANGEKS